MHTLNVCNVYTHLMIHLWITHKPTNLEYYYPATTVTKSKKTKFVKKHVDFYEYLFASQSRKAINSRCTRWTWFSRLTCISLENKKHNSIITYAYGSRRLITLIWSHTCQFVISFITTFTIHYSFSLPLQAKNSSFPQIFSSVVLLPFHPPDWLHGLQLFFVFLGHVGFNFGIVC